MTKPASPPTGKGPPAAAEAIIFDGVTKHFPGNPRPAVDGVSLTVREGHLVVLLGPSGCGKTTLMKMVNRLYEHDTGTILVGGRDITSLPVTTLRRGIGYVIQSVGLFPHMRVDRNIAVVPQLLGWDPARIDRRVDELLALVGLPPEEYRRRYPRQLSGGQQQRVGLARAMAADPAIMLMDEPFAAIDNITRRRLQDELIRIQRTVRKTTLFVTHDVEEALRLADEIVVMKDGRVLQYDTPLRLLTAPADDFVAQLVGAEDALRRLSLLTVGPAMLPPAPPAAHLPALAPTDDLREALTLLLRTGADALPVQSADGQVIGTLSLDVIRRLTQPAPSAAPSAGA
ncbi:MAG TPA: ABC transporter ATP-binding protein, partial [Chloroflexia bacterium]|nr:ABC transporter ATP-binding protein [Chloroflexia bacterium]